ncbi:3-hydroxyacyl-CoA dehydrogenase NAD-binding domain-containing protein [Streptomyces kebangsaanensis]|uniref:3-hydroxyacyl-CoA dehydrogenase NAD-binding domain-containing protein n=1 Tax=Streptomyces kebangsaanensis TaxID=864058 RepID=UPI00093C70DC|nr:3-hydroxyacyl-CoA dehydrogenase NAD-binding domain-containing protein [Streptomyces kebangsaanensis]
MTSVQGPIAVVGTGAIGAGRAAFTLAHGHDVRAYDPDPEAEGRLRAQTDAAWPALTRLGLADRASPRRLTFTTALLGPIVNQHLSGGPGGLAHTLEHLGPPAQERMDDLRPVRLTPELAARLVAGVDDEPADVDQPAMNAQRDEPLRTRRAHDQLP